MPDDVTLGTDPSERSTRTTGKVKGTLLLARMKYLEAQGPENAGRVMRRLAKVDQVLLQDRIFPSSWYPADVLMRLEMTAVAILSNGDRGRLFREMGRFSASTNLGPSGVQHPFVREGDPHALLREVPRMYASQHSSGHRVYERTGDRSAFIRTFGEEELVAEDCLTTIGWMQRAIEICGGRNVRVLEMRCRARKHDCCEYRCEWD